MVYWESCDILYDQERKFSSSGQMVNSSCKPMTLSSDAQLMSWTWPQLEMPATVCRPSLASIQASQLRLAWPLSLWRLSCISSGLTEVCVSGFFSGKWTAGRAERTESAAFRDVIWTKLSPTMPLRFAIRNQGIYAQCITTIVLRVWY